MSYFLEKCFENENFLDCGSSCPDTCDNYKNPNRICTLQCVQGCFCKAGLVLNADGKLSFKKFLT